MSNQLFKEIINNFKKLFLSNVTSTLIGFITLPIVFKYLSPEEYGSFTLMFSLLGVLTILNQIISGNTILPFITKCIEDNDEQGEVYFLKLYIVSGTIFLVLSIGLISSLALFVYKIKFDLFLIFLGYLYIYQINSYLLNISLMYKEYNYITTVTVLRSILRLLIILILILVGTYSKAIHNMITYFATELIILLVVSSQKIIYLYRKYKKNNMKDGQIRNYIQLKQIMKYNMYNFFGTNIIEVKKMLIVWIINTFLSIEMVGVYGAINKIVSVIESIYKNIEVSIFPYVTSIINNRESKNVVSRINVISVIISVAFIVFLSISNKYIISYLLSDSYLMFSNIFIVGYFRILVSSFRISQKSILYSLQLTHLIFWGSVIELIVFITMLFIFVSSFGNSLVYIIVFDIISRFISVIYKKIKLDIVMDVELVH